MDETRLLKAATGRLTLIGKLTDKRRELMAQVYELDEEVQRILGGESGIGDRLKAVYLGFGTAWTARYRGEYLWTYFKDTPAAKRLLKILTPEQIGERATRYLADDDPFYVKARHPFGLFVMNINRYAAAAESVGFDLEADVVADCHHSPACRTDVEHTRRRATELRA